jgi:hypothetical protein
MRRRSLKTVTGQPIEDAAADARLVRAWKKWHAEELKEACTGPHRHMLERLVEVLKNLNSGPATLLAFVRAVDWSGAELAVRNIALHEIHRAIIRQREHAGLAPFDDSEPDNVFRRVKTAMFDF